MVRLVKVVKNSGGTKTTVYEGDDGNTYTLKGDLSVRANNPGNISPSAKNRQFWIDNFGAIDFVPSSPGEPWVAVFPDAESGRAAQRYLWSTGAYQNLTIEQAAARWATDAYPDALAQAAGVPKSTLVKDLTPEQMDAMFAAQTAAEGSSNLVVKDAAGNILDPAIITGGHPVPPGLIGGESPALGYTVRPGDTLEDIASRNGTTVEALAAINDLADPNRIFAGQTLNLTAPVTSTETLQGIQDRNAEAQGFGAIPPVPAMRSDVLADLKRRTELAANTPLPPPRPDVAEILKQRIQASSGAPEALGITPVLPENYDQPGAYTPEQLKQIARGTAPEMDQSNVQARATILDEGLGSLLSGYSPSAPNPTPQTTAPALETKEPIRTGNPEPVPTPQVRQPTMGTLKGGKQVEIGKSYVIGDKLMIAEPGPNGTATLRDVENVRDDWLRQNVDPNAPLLFEDSIAGTAARMIAAPMIKQGVDSAVGNVTSAIGDTAGSIVDAATQLFNNGLSKFAPTKAPVSANANLSSAREEQAAQRTKSPTIAPTMITGRPDAPVGSMPSTSVKSTSANANLSDARSEQSAQRTAPVIPKTTLTAPGAGITHAEKAAIAAYTPRTVSTTIRNPAYDEWVAKYGDGSQVQTAPTGGLITANQLAAISGSGAPIPATKTIVPPPPPPKTIQVQQTLPGVVPNAQPQPRAKTPDMAVQDMLVSAITMLTGSDMAGDLARTMIGGLNNGGKRTGSAATGTGTNGYTYLNGVNLGYSAAEKARREAEGKAIGQANRSSPNPTYNISGDNNAFQPQSVQDSVRWQTGY